MCYWSPDLRGTRNDPSTWLPGRAPLPSDDDNDNDEGLNVNVEFDDPPSQAASVIVVVVVVVIPSQPVQPPDQLHTSHWTGRGW